VRVSKTREEFLIGEESFEYKEDFFKWGDNFEYNKGSSKMRRDFWMREGSHDYEEEFWIGGGSVRDCTWFKNEKIASCHVVYFYTAEAKNNPNSHGVGHMGPTLF
jgi:hypothetical protein